MHYVTFSLRAREQKLSAFSNAVIDAAPVHC